MIYCEYLVKSVLHRYQHRTVHDSIAIYTGPMFNVQCPTHPSIHSSTSTQNQIKLVYFKIKLFHLIALLNTKITSVPLSIPKIEKKVILL